MRGSGTPGATEKQLGSEVSPVNANFRNARGRSLGVGEGVWEGVADIDIEGATAVDSIKLGLKRNSVGEL